MDVATQLIQSQIFLKLEVFHTSLLTSKIITKVICDRLIISLKQSCSSILIFNIYAPKKKNIELSYGEVAHFTDNLFPG